MNIGLNVRKSDVGKFNYFFNAIMHNSNILKELLKCGQIGIVIMNRWPRLFLIIIFALISLFFITYLRRFLLMTILSRFFLINHLLYQLETFFRCMCLQLKQETHILCIRNGFVQWSLSDWKVWQIYSLWKAKKKRNIYQTLTVSDLPLSYPLTKEYFSSNELI
jgi:hypothetical protein